MSDHVLKTSLDEEATPRTPSQACQPSWMSQWTIKNSEVASRVIDSSMVSSKNGLVDVAGKSEALPITLNVANGFSRNGKGVIKDSDETISGIMSETKKQGHYKCETSDYEFGNKNLCLALALGRVETSTDLKLRNESMLRTNEKHYVSNSFEEIKGLGAPKYRTQKKDGLTFGPPPHGSKKGDTSRPVVVFERHFSNDNFTCFGKDSCKYQKYSSLLLHETDMKNDLTYEARQNDARLHLQNGQTDNKNFQAFFGKKQPVSVPNHLSTKLLPSCTRLPNINHEKSRLLENVSVRNVETVRICTMVDSVENSPEGYQKISQRARHVMFTKETCANLTAHCEEKTFVPFDVSHGVGLTRPSGVKIQPLWTSTESEEKENTGNSSVFKAGSRNEASVEADSMQENASHSRYNLSGMTSSPLRKDKSVDENNSPASFELRAENSRTKRKHDEISNINEELPGVQVQPAVSSTDDEQPSTSRVHSLNAKHLFSNKRQTTICNDSQKHSVSPDPGNRWIKCLKRNTSDSVGVGTKSSDGDNASHPKFNTFFNRIMKCGKESLDPELSKLHGKEQIKPEKNSESVVSKMDNSIVNGGRSWIQRWCQNNKIPRLKNSEPLVICEPHSLKLGQDEIIKKQFPSIGALALMGKAMNGYRSCEFRKRGSVVVWNTRD